MLKRVFGLIAVIVIVALVIVAVRSRMDQGAAAATTTETSTVQRGTLEVTLDATGSLEPVTQASLSFTTGGRVADVPARLGDAVASGQPLVVLDTTDLEFAVQSAESSLASAQSGLRTAGESLADLKSGPSARDLDVARTNLEKAKNQLWATQSQRDSTCGAFERWKGLPEDQQKQSQGGSEASCNSAQASVQQGELSVHLAELDLEDVQNGPSASELSAAEEKWKQAEAQGQSAQIQVEQARLKLQNATLTSPISGTVTLLSPSVGDQVGGSTAVVTVSDLTDLQVQVLLDQTDVAAASVGQKARITVDALPDEKITGEITSIAPVGQSDSGVVLFPVTVHLDETAADVRPGMTASVSIITRQAENALLVPRRAIQTRNGQTFVMVQTAAGVRAVPVKLGATTDSEAEVTEGLTEGQVVVVPSSASGTTSGTSTNQRDQGFGGPGMMMPIDRP
jgi:RND family efflux transporter MFP subunit